MKNLMQVYLLLMDMPHFGNYMASLGRRIHFNTFSEPANIYLFEILQMFAADMPKLLPKTSI